MRKRERMNLHKRGRRLGGTQHREAHSARANASFKSREHFVRTGRSGYVVREQISRTTQSKCPRGEGITWGSQTSGEDKDQEGCDKTELLCVVLEYAGYCSYQSSGSLAGSFRACFSK